MDYNSILRSYMIAGGGRGLLEGVRDAVTGCFDQSRVKAQR